MARRRKAMEEICIIKLAQFFVLFMECPLFSIPPASLPIKCSRETSRRHIAVSLGS